MQRLFRTALALCMMLVLAAPAPAAEVKRFVVLPFAVNGPSGFSYLGQAIPSMLSSRLFWEGHFEPSSAAAGTQPGQAAAQKAVSSADYAVWGDVNIVGDDASVDMRVLAKDGKEWRRSAKARVNNLIPALQSLADTANADLFGRKTNAAGKAMGSGPLNPEMLQKETTQTQVYLNPQIRYQGSEGSRMRTQAMTYAAAGMIVADLTGDGRNEVGIISDTKLNIYRWENDRLVPLGEKEFVRSEQLLSVRSIDLNRDGAHEIVVSAYDEAYTEPYSSVLSFKGGKFTEIVSRQRMYMNVVKLPPDYRPVLVGQKGDSQVVFGRSGVHELERSGDGFVFGRRVDLPSGVNLYNFSWLPAGGKDAERLVTINGNERLQVFTPTGTALYTSQDQFSGSAVGIMESNNMPGMGSNDVMPRNFYYMPLRMLATDLDRNKEWELLVNKPISLASQVFDRYRTFPEGEIQALSWDGVGMSMLWKTRRIKGSVADFELADVNNDGVLDLVVCLNTHPGALGLSNRKCMLVAYPLDQNNADPNTAPVIEN